MPRLSWPSSKGGKGIRKVGYAALEDGMESVSSLDTKADSHPWNLNRSSKPRSQWVSVYLVITNLIIIGTLLVMVVRLFPEPSPDNLRGIPNCKYC